MKKGTILSFSLLLTLFFTLQTVDARWYGSFPQPVSGTTWCETDPDTTGGSPSFSRSPLAGSYSYDSRVVSGNSSSIVCERWDAAIPGGTSVNSPSGWTRGSVTVSVSCTDTGGSGCRAVNNSGWSRSGFTYSRTFSSNTSGSINVGDVAGNNGTASYSVGNIDLTPPICGTWVEQSGWGQTRIMTLSSSWDGESGIADAGGTCTVSVEGGTCTESIRDNVGNTTTCTSPGATRVDTTPPTLADITSQPNQNLLANNNFAYNLAIGTNGGAPISGIGYQKENSTNQSLSSPIVDYTPSLSMNWNISNVDQFRTVDGNAARQFTLRLRQFCDEALNCWTGTYDINHNVYANAGHLVGPLSTKNMAHNFGSSHIADGTSHSAVISLADSYGNDVIPAVGINRTVNFDFNTDNTLNLNQYTQNGGSGVFASIPANPAFAQRFAMGNNQTTSFNNQPSLNGQYDFNYRVYTPTADASRPLIDSGERFEINSVSVRVSDNLIAPTSGTVNNTSNVNFDFVPLYEAMFDNSSDLKRYGFIEGGQQDSDINITTNNLGVSGSNKRLYLEFGGIESANLELTASGNLSSTIVTEAPSPLITIFQADSGFVGNAKELKTLLIQDAPISSLERHYLSTHINYTLDGFNITYNADVIGMDHYHGGFSGNNTTQVGIKVLGKTYSEKQQNITTNQDSDINKVAGNITKSILKKNIRSNAYNLVKNLNVTLGTSNSLLNGDVVYYKLSNTVLNYSSIPAAYKIGGKTILVEGGNLLINTNINITGVLGIVVLKDDSGNGGNIYIDDGVGNIEATLYTDKVILPYSSVFSRVLDQDDSVANFANQLYIKGSLFSNNTIGGARKTPKECPYYIAACDIKEAQKYDLNFIRRYFRYDSDIPLDGILDTVANGGNSSTGISASNLDYPLVIEYNPLIQTSPPPLFSNR